MHPQPISIVGAGIAGLACASFLHRQGLRVQVFERRKTNVTQSGVGLLLLENGLDILNLLGLERRINEVGRKIASFKKYDKYGKLLYSNPVNRCVAIDRASLLKSLHQAADGVAISYNEGIKSIENTTSGSVLKTMSSRSFPSSHIIGADGRGSWTRKLLFPDCELIKTCESEIVGKVKHPEVFNLIQDNFFKVIDPDGGLAVGLIPLQNDEIIWYLQYSVEKYPSLYDSGKESLLVEMDKLIGDWSFPVNIIQELISRSEFYHWKVELLNQVLPQYGLGSVSLIGDAAHPLLTFSSQGANSALVDAFELARLLYDVKDDRIRQNEISSKLTNLREPQIAEYRASEAQLLEAFLNPFDATNQRTPLAK